MTKLEYLVNKYKEIDKILVDKSWPNWWSGWLKDSCELKNFAAMEKTIYTVLKK